MMFLSCLCTFLPIASAIQRGTRTSYTPPQGTGATVSVVQPGGHVDLQPAMGPTGDVDSGFAEIRSTTVKQTKTTTVAKRTVEEKNDLGFGAEEVNPAKSFVTMPDGSELPMTWIDGKWRVDEPESSFSQGITIEAKDGQCVMKMSLSEIFRLNDYLTGMLFDKGMGKEKAHNDKMVLTNMLDCESVDCSQTETQLKEQGILRPDGSPNSTLPSEKYASECGLKTGDKIVALAPALFTTSDHMSSVEAFGAKMEECEWNTASEFTFSSKMAKLGKFAAEMKTGFHLGLMIGYIPASGTCAEPPKGSVCYGL